jgi:hypothetical protein
MLQVAHSAPWMTGHTNFTGYLVQNEVGGKLWSSQTYFKIQIISFIIALNRAACHRCLSFLCKKAAVLRDTINGTPVLSQHWGLRKTINLVQEAP